MGDMVCKRRGWLVYRERNCQAPSPWEAEVGELLRVVGHPSLPDELQAILGHRVKPCFINKTEISGSSVGRGVVCMPGISGRRRLKQVTLEPDFMT